MRDLERERAADALAKVRNVEAEPDEVKRRYRSYVDRFGGALVMNGLGQALATEHAAAEGGAGGPDKRAHQALAEHVSSWLTRAGGVYASAGDAMAAILSGDQARYVRAQTETLAWLAWHKKFCHAYLPKGGDE
jgi:CRISPR type III-B/RAMP module-associated protein Cmr5